MFVYKRITGITLSALAAFMMCFASGCASGGFKLTRSYAGFVNQQHIVLRIVLYILTLPVFVVTLVIDAVVFNTMDFWNGRVAAGDYHFEKDGRTYAVHHRYLPKSGLRESRIEISGQGLQAKQEIILRETPAAEIEVYLNGKLSHKVSDVSELPQITSAAGTYVLRKS